MPYLLLAAILGLAQQEPAGFHAETHLVQINVIVRDKEGPVKNLRQSDFTLSDRGKPPVISVFSFHNRAALPAGTEREAALPANTFSNRALREADAPASVTMILLDRLNTLLNTSLGGVEQTSLFSVGQALETAKQQLLKFIDQLDPRERVAIYSLGESLTVLSDFTGDRTQLRKIIENYRAASITSHEVAEPGGVSVIGDINASINRDRQALAGLANGVRAQRTMAALLAMSAHVAGIPGRKNLVWLTSDIVIPAEALGRALSRSQIAIYPVDARGLQPYSMERTQADADARAHDGGPWRGSPNFTGAGPTVPIGQNAMQVLADETGGRAFMNSNDLTGAIRKAIDDGAASYTLGFYVDDSSLDGKFHELKVRVKKSSLDVRAQRGYFATKNSPAPEIPLTSPLETSAIRIVARVEHAEEGLAISGSIDVRDLHFELIDGARNGSAEILVVQQDAAGNTLQKRTQVLELKLNAAEWESSLRSGAGFRSVFQPKEGLGTLRVIITNRADGITGNVIIPVSEIK